MALILPSEINGVCSPCADDLAESYLVGFLKECFADNEFLELVVEKVEDYRYFGYGTPFLPGGSGSIFYRAVAELVFRPCYGWILGVDIQAFFSPAVGRPEAWHGDCASEVATDDESIVYCYMVWLEAMPEALGPCPVPGDQCYQTLPSPENPPGTPLYEGGWNGCFEGYAIVS